MCFNMVIYCQSRCELTDDAVEVLVEKMLTNDDGFMVYATKKNREIRYVRTMSMKQALATLTTLPKFTLLHTHFRFASSGAKVIENVHGWRVGGLIISHNGTVIEYAYVDKEKSDTRMLVEDARFRQAIERREWGNVAEVIESVRFWGVMFLTSPREVYVVSRCKSFYYVSVDDIAIITNDYVFEEQRRIEPAIYALDLDTLELEKLADTKCSYYYDYRHQDILTKYIYPKSYLEV